LEVVMDGKIWILVVGPYWMKHLEFFSKDITDEKKLNCCWKAMLDEKFRFSLESHNG